MGSQRISSSSLKGCCITARYAAQPHHHRHEPVCPLGDNPVLASHRTQQLHSWHMQYTGMWCVLVCKPWQPSVDWVGDHSLHVCRWASRGARADLSRKPKAAASAMQGCSPRRYGFSPSICDRAASSSSISMLMSVSEYFPSPCASAKGDLCATLPQHCTHQG